MSAKVPTPPPRYPRPSAQLVTYVTAEIHEGVRFGEFVTSLNRAGFAFSNVSGRGLVIRRIGQDPERPAQPFTEEPA